MLPPAAGASYARTAKEGREPLSRVPFFLVPHFCLSPLLYLSIRVHLFLPLLLRLLFHPLLACARYSLHSSSAPTFPTIFPPFYFYYFFIFSLVLFCFLLFFCFLFLEKVRDSYFLLYVFPPNPCVANEGASSGWLFYLFIYFSLSRI